MKRITKVLCGCTLSLATIFSFFGCKKKTTTTKKNNTTKIVTTANSPTSTNKKTTNKTTNKTTTRKTTTKQTTTEENNKNTFINIFEGYSSINATISYEDKGITKTITETSYITDDVAFDITLSFIGDYEVTITDGEDVTKYYLIFEGEYIFFGEHEDVDPQTYSITNYIPKTKTVSITYRNLEFYSIKYDKLANDVTMEFDGTDYNNSTIRSVREKDKVNATIKNNSNSRVLFEVYRYDLENEPTILVESHIIGKNSSYVIDEFEMPTYDLYFKVTEYIAYSVTYDEEFATNENVTYDFKAILDDSSKTLTNGEYLGGTKIKISIINDTNQMLAFCILNESRSVIFAKNILPNTTYEMTDDGLFELDKNILITSELVNCYKLTLGSSCPSYLSFNIHDYYGNGYNFGDYIRSNYMAISIFNNSDTKTVGVYAYNEMDVAIDYRMVRSNDSKTITLDNINMNLHIVIEEYDAPKKFKTIIDNEAGATIKAYANYNYNTEVDINSEFDWATEMILEINNLTSKRIVAKAVDYRGQLVACIPVKPGGAMYLNYSLEHDVTVYIDNDERMVFLIEPSFGFQGEIITVSDINGVTVELENKILLIDKGTELIVKVECPSYSERVWVKDLAGGPNICDEVKVNKGSSVTFELTMNYDASVAGIAIM